jgi:hypothetical protein
MADYGKRKCKYCQKVFNKRAPLDSYCSVKCNIVAKNERDKKKNKPSPKPIAKFSSNRAKRNAAYLVANKLFLAKDENKFCPVMAQLKNQTVRATEVHHINGREGERLNDQEYWIGVSREGHQWIHSFPKEAREKGWLI